MCKHLNCSQSFVAPAVVRNSITFWYFFFACASRLHNQSVKLLKCFDLHTPRSLSHSGHPHSVFLLLTKHVVPQSLRAKKPDSCFIKHLNFRCCVLSNTSLCLTQKLSYSLLKM